MVPLPLPLTAPPLQALQCERNRSLLLQPGAVCLRSLQQLTCDWCTALSSAAALRAATQLSRLILAGPGRHQYGGRVNPIATAESLLEALSAMPKLRRVDEVCRVELTSHLAALSLPKVHAMWQLGRRCPHVQLGTLESAEAAGWIISPRPGHRLNNN